MQSDFPVSLKGIIEEFGLEKIHFTNEMEDIKVTSTDVNRPGLQMVDFFDYFDPSRIQIFGKVEITFMEEMPSQDRLAMLKKLCSTKVPAIVLTRGMDIFPEFIVACQEHSIPLLRSSSSTSDFLSSLIAYLNVQLAPRITRHGVLVEVYGEGVLILGDSGVGKSETAVELLKRGHRLVADDAVEIKRVSANTLVGSSPDNIRHFIEIRGIGIINVRNIFGMGAVKLTEKVDLIVHLELWKEHGEYDRLGLDETYTEILGIQVPSLKIPVKHGRNLAVIMEVAAMNNRQKKMGFNAAEELNKRLIENMAL